MDYTTNLEIKLPFEGNRNDSTGNYTVVSYNNTFTTGKIGLGAYFASTSDNITYPPLNILGISKFSINIWIKPNTPKTSIIAGQYAAAPNGKLWVTSLTSDNSVRFLIVDSDGGGDFYGETALNLIPQNIWTNLAFVFDGTKTGNTQRLKIYINGANQALSFTGTIGNQINPTTNYNLVIGNLTTVPSLYFSGVLDEFYLWKNRALTDNEVMEIYTATTTNFFNLI